MSRGEKTSFGEFNKSAKFVSTFFRKISELVAATPADDKNSKVECVSSRPLTVLSTKCFHFTQKSRKTFFQLIEILPVDCSQDGARCQPNELIARLQLILEHPGRALAERRHRLLLLQTAAQLEVAHAHEPRLLAAAAAVVRWIVIDIFVQQLVLLPAMSLDVGKIFFLKRILTIL